MIVVFILEKNNSLASNGSSVCVHSSHPRYRLVVPFKRSQSVTGHCGEGVDEMSAEMQRDVLRPKLAERRSVLRPVRVVAHSSIAVLLLLTTSADTCK